MGSSLSNTLNLSLEVSLRRTGGRQGLLLTLALVLLICLFSPYQRDVLPAPLLFLPGAFPSSEITAPQRLLPWKEFRVGKLDRSELQASFCMLNLHCTLLCDAETPLRLLLTAIACVFQCVPQTDPNPCTFFIKPAVLTFSGHSVPLRQLWWRK